MKQPILRDNHNCSGLKKIDRLAVLIDGDEYYRAFFNVVKKAKYTVNILGWEFESQINLDEVKAGFPDNLRVFFKELTTKNNLLKVNIQTWRSPLYLLFGRERFAEFKWKNETPDNVEFHDVSHPSVYGSFHEKLAVIDNSCAFLGGIDITRKRWDTPQHKFNNSLRKDHEGNTYYPIHDIQTVCTGEIVEELNRYMCQRNQKASVSKSRHALWPEQELDEVHDIYGGCSRTSQERQTYEIENLYLDAINSSEEYIYIENQYLTHKTIVKALCQRLEEENGPEIVIILPKNYRGLFEKAVYLTQREKALKRMKDSDRFNRLLICFPDHINEDRKKFIVVHSKIMIVDGVFMTIGSANLNHRSMRVDNEINLSIESNNRKTEDFIKHILIRLLSEHLGVDTELFKRTLEKHHSLIDTILTFKGSRMKTLTELPHFQLSPIEEFLRISTPMVDVSYPIPKNYLFILIFSIVFMGLMFAKEFVE